MQVLSKEIRHAVDGYRDTVFAKGTPISKLPADTAAYAKRKGFIVEGKAITGEEDKAVDAAPENKTSDRLKKRGR